MNILFRVTDRVRVFALGLAHTMVRELGLGLVIISERECYQTKLRPVNNNHYPML